MTPDIVNKITQELDQQIVSERQVVYILVELRKLLESIGVDKDIRYRALIFCCDWAVHPKLNRESARAITLLFDRFEAQCRQAPVGMSQANIPGLVEFCDHSRFRDQFIEACEHNGIPAGAARDDAWWRSFIRYFSEVVRDCPIEVRAGDTVHVSRITASAIDPRSIGVFNREYAISWVWECRDHQNLSTTATLF